uniref:NAD(+) diphosphatase n=1 Tax=uncultured bacterium contig00061 TaxID=1181544 RepID=A0A806JZ02_9BACT|nr:NADH pyrophosphatase [uncultured bacterium contig00061]
MEFGAFFFQETSLLLPKEAPVAKTEWEIPMIHAAGFPQADIFAIPALNNAPGVSLSSEGASSPEGASSREDSISCVSVPPGIPLPPSWQAIPVRQALSLLANFPAGSSETGARMLRAFHIAQWRQESLFCGKCGCKNTDHLTELARVCTSCGHMEFPLIAPAVIVIITNDEGKVLLAHNRKFTPGVYSLIAGFVEAGENLEAAVARETREEVSIEIRDIRYAVSQPWPFPNSLMAGFSARYASGDIRPDGVEIEDAQWFSRDNLPTLPGPGSLSRYLIEQWQKTVIHDS